jgi:predicted membrane-bound spermidine synthase
LSLEAGVTEAVSASRGDEDARGREAPGWITFVFFASGFAALVYQVVWQRALFAIFGINTDAVTVVVTAFLLGLGLGSILGGILSRLVRYPLLLFALSEFGIAAFGVVSLDLFRRVGTSTVEQSALANAATTFLLLLAPTLLMGMTLPLLVAYLVQRSGNVGRSTSLLYFVNTAGSGIASLASVTLLLPHLGEHGSVRVAAVTNVIVGAIVLAHHLRQTSDA